MSVRIKRRVFLVLASSLALAKDDQDSSEKVYELGPGMTAPKVIKQVTPRSQGVRIVGTVTVVLVVGSTGVPRDVRVSKGLDKDLDRSTVEAVEQWRFEPAKKDGKPIAVRVSLDIAFHDM